METHLSIRTSATGGTRDGTGAGDHDQPYRFGRRPRAIAPYPFNTREFARLLLLRSRLQEDMLARTVPRAERLT